MLLRAGVDFLRLRATALARQLEVRLSCAQKTRNSLGPLLNSKNQTLKQDMHTFVPRGPGRRPKLLFLFADDRFFWSHRLPVARAALGKGYEVVVATGVYEHVEEIRDEGFRLLPLRLIRKNGSPLSELRAVAQVRQIYRKEQPDIVHHVGIKPVLYGSLASLGLGYPTVNALTGLGYLAASPSRKAALIRSFVWGAFRPLLDRPNQLVLVENEDDYRLLTSDLKVRPSRVILTRGSGVDVHAFHPTPEPIGKPVVTFASRMLWIKGIKEFVDAAGLLRTKGISARFVLAGDTDMNNPSCVPREKLREWQSAATVEWWGHQRQMQEVFRQTNLVCLPSHGGEGVPKVLMEAAASGRAIVTTNVPGCREIVQAGVNGIVIQPGNAIELANAIERLLEDPTTRKRMGMRSREIAVNEFSEDSVVRQTLELYGELLNPHSAPVQTEARAATPF